MQQKKNFFPVFLGLLVVSALIFFLSRAGFLNGLTGFLEQIATPIQSGFYTILHKSDDSENAKLSAENSKLNAELADKIKQDREIQALRDQFATTNPKPRALLTAKIIGMTGQEIIIDKGKNDGVKNGLVVVVGNNLIGTIAKTSENIAAIEAITVSTNLTAKTAKTDSLGVVKSFGGNLILDNVDLTESLQKDDFVLTNGDIDNEGHGFPPDLVVGKIVSVNKKASNLFQSASIKSLVNFSKLEMVFVMISN